MNKTNASKKLKTAKTKHAGKEETRRVETTVVALILRYHQVKVRDGEGHVYALTRKTTGCTSVHGPRRLPRVLSAALASLVLPPSTQAAGVVASQREPRVPAAWPGTYVPNFSDWREGDIDDIAILARQHIGEPYSVVQAIVSKVVPGTVPARDALYCSTFVGLVVADATGFDLSSEPAHQPLHPGTLAAHPDLTDVLLEWRQL